MERKNDVAYSIYMKIYYICKAMILYYIPKTNVLKGILRQVELFIR